MNDAASRQAPAERAADGVTPQEPQGPEAEDPPPREWEERTAADAPRPPGPPAPGERAGPDDGADPAAPAPLRVPRTPTGSADVDALLERLADADHLATDGHPEVYEDVHRGLRDALTALDARPGPPAPPPPYGNRS